MKPVVYFLCTGNSCRSQMAEGWLRTLAGDRMEVHSAGIERHGLNPRAVAAMAEAGIDISHHESKLIDSALLNRADYVITLCGDAEETCPWTPPSVRRIHWGLPDPARAVGSEAAVQEAFRTVRDAIGAHIRQFLQDEFGEGDHGGIGPSSR